MSLIRFEYCYCDLEPNKLGCVLSNKKECVGKTVCLGCVHYKLRKENESCGQSYRESLVEC